MKYCFIIMLALPAVLSVPGLIGKSKISPKILKSTCKRPLRCPSQDLYCVKLKNMTTNTRDSITILLNKCDLEYVKCRGFHITDLPMKVCNHHEESKQMGKTRKKRHVSKDRDYSSGGNLEEKTDLDHVAHTYMNDGEKEYTSQEKGGDYYDSDDFGYDDDNYVLKKSGSDLGRQVDALHKQVDDVADVLSNVQKKGADDKSFGQAGSDLARQVNMIDEKVDDIADVLSDIQERGVNKSPESAGSDLARQVDAIDRQVDDVADVLSDIQDRGVSKSLKRVPGQAGSDLARQVDAIDEQVDDVADVLSDIQHRGVSKSQKRAPGQAGSDLARQVDAIDKQVDDVADVLSDIQDRGVNESPGQAGSDMARQVDAIDAQVDDVADVLSDIQDRGVDDQSPEAGSDLARQVDAIDEQVDDVADVLSDIQERSAEMAAGASIGSDMQRHVDAIDEAIDDVADVLSEVQEKGEDDGKEHAPEQADGDKENDGEKENAGENEDFNIITADDTKDAIDAEDPVNKERPDIEDAATKDADSQVPDINDDGTNIDDEDTTAVPDEDDVSAKDAANTNGDTNGMIDGNDVGEKDTNNVNEDKETPDGENVDYALNEKADLEEYNKDCPSVCPARDVMVCARCKDNVYRSFLSICHLKMFNCKHPQEKLELVSRLPCVLSAPYLAGAPPPKGRISEPGDVDRVLQFIRCRENGKLKKGDPRCNFDSGSVTKVPDE